MSAWFIRKEKGINTPTKEKREAPDGLWYKCPKCDEVVLTKTFIDNANTCSSCNHHDALDSAGYFKLLFDNNKFEELDATLQSADPLEFTDSKPYPDRVAAAQKKTGLTDAVRSATGLLEGKAVTIACMDFKFIGGSMGSVVGEKIARAIDHARQNGQPFIMISKSGGARMMEGALSLMQMAKTSARLAQLAKAKLPYISVLTHPTTGGVSASFGMLGDFNIAEPKALIGFAGPRVIRDTIGKDLPEGFQSSEFLVEKGFVDYIVHRRNLKSNLNRLFEMIG